MLFLFSASAFSIRVKDVNCEFAQIQNSLLPMLTGLAATQTGGSAVFEQIHFILLI